MGQSDNIDEECKAHCGRNNNFRSLMEIKIILRLSHFIFLFTQRYKQNMIVAKEFLLYCEHKKCKIGTGNFFFFFNISKSKTYSNIVNEILGTLFNIIELTNHSISTENSWYFL